MVKKEMNPRVISRRSFFSGDISYRITFDKQTPADLQENEKKSKAISEEEKKQLQLVDEEMPNSPMNINYSRKSDVLIV